MLCDDPQALTDDPKNEDVVGTAYACSRLRNRIEHRLQIGG